MQEFVILLDKVFVELEQLEVLQALGMLVVELEKQQLFELGFFEFVLQYELEVGLFL